MRREAIVSLYDEPCGILAKTTEGYEFTYHQDYVGAPISLSLPVRIETYFSDTLFPYFESLAPEGWLLELRSRVNQLDEKDKFGHLLLCGEDLIGAVTIVEVKS